MKRTSLILLVFIMMALSGCSPYHLVNSRTCNGCDLSIYHTFRIVTPDEGSLPPDIEPVTYYNIAAAIREQMIKRGFKESPTSNMMINIGISVNKEIGNQSTLPPGHQTYQGPTFNGCYPYFIYGRDSYQSADEVESERMSKISREGVLTIDFVNTEQGILIYTASVSTIFDNGTSRIRDLKGIAEAVNTLFSKFPEPLLPRYRDE